MSTAAEIQPSIPQEPTPEEQLQEKIDEWHSALIAFRKAVEAVKPDEYEIQATKERLSIAEEEIRKEYWQAQEVADKAFTNNDRDHLLASRAYARKTEQAFRLIQQNSSWLPIPRHEPVEQTKIIDDVPVIIEEDDASLTLTNEDIVESQLKTEARKTDQDEMITRAKEEQKIQQLRDALWNIRARKDDRNDIARSKAEGYDLDTLVAKSKLPAPESQPDMLEEIRTETEQKITEIDAGERRRDFRQTSQLSAEDLQTEREMIENPQWQVPKREKTPKAPWLTQRYTLSEQRKNDLDADRQALLSLTDSVKKELQHIERKVRGEVAKGMYPTALLDRLTKLHPYEEEKKAGIFKRLRFGMAKLWSADSTYLAMEERYKTLKTQLATLESRIVKIAKEVEDFSIPSKTEKMRQKEKQAKKRSTFSERLLRMFR